MTYEIASEILGSPGRLLSASKQARGRDIFWNACVFNKDREQIWHGDIDFDADKDALKKLADRLDSILYVTRETPFRFDGLDKGAAKQAKKDLVNNATISEDKIRVIL